MSPRRPAQRHPVAPRPKNPLSIIENIDIPSLTSQCSPPVPIDKKSGKLTDIQCLEVAYVEACILERIVRTPHNLEDTGFGILNKIRSRLKANAAGDNLGYADDLVGPGSSMFPSTMSVAEGRGNRLEKEIKIFTDAVDQRLDKLGLPKVQEHSR